MEWYVYRRDINAGKIDKFNVFSHFSFNKEVRKIFNEYSNIDEFSERLRREAQYYFWAKCEHEVVITSWPPYVSTEEVARLNKELDEYETKWGHKPKYINVRPTVGEKIDIYDQLMLNWDTFVSYVYTHLNLEKENKYE